MQWKLLTLALSGTANAAALLRFSCSQLVVERLDPLVNPGVTESPHLHQVVGGNAFNASMTADIPSTATCTTCQFGDDFSNYWTAVMYFRARNGTFKRVRQTPNVGFEAATGGMTIYYISSVGGGRGAAAGSASKSTVTAFKPGFRMLVGDPSYRTKSQADKYRQLTYTCLQNAMTRSGETKDFPTKPCPAGIMTNIRFPTCWDGQNLDSADHQSHVAYPTSGTFESGGPCPSTHPVKVPQVFYETVWDTKVYSDKAMWPEDGSQPFVWSYGDKTGFGTHGDYVFGWKDGALQKAMDGNCNGNSCTGLKTQSLAVGNKCSKAVSVKEDIDGWLSQLPGGMMVN